MALGKKRLVVLASGRGTNFKALAEGIRCGDLLGFEMVGLISNRANAQVLQLAQSLKIPTYLIESKPLFQDKPQGRIVYDSLLRELLLSLCPNIIALAGYMLILDPITVDSFRGQILNIHPSLLPKYPGLQPQKQALDAGEKETGCTVHYVTNELDAGPILLQKKVPILPEDNEESLSKRLLTVEHQTYLEALKLLDL